ncbi:hypothetical protein BD309DRAFT_632634 [Dichomitus squalens]|nr:hypothetical protein BD309DRAFT_632634 [Dichomitus squalens]
MPPFESSSGLVFPSPSSSLSFISVLCCGSVERRPLWNGVMYCCCVVSYLLSSFVVVYFQAASASPYIYRLFADYSGQCCSYPSPSSVLSFTYTTRRTCITTEFIAFAAPSPPLPPPPRSCHPRSIYHLPDVSPAVFCRRRIYPRSTCGRASRSHYVAV